MAGPRTRTCGDAPVARASFRDRGVRFIRGAMEALVLTMVCASPWGYGCVHPGFEVVLTAGVEWFIARGG